MMFGRSKANQVTTVTTGNKNCTHECYSGHRDGDYLICACTGTGCDHVWSVFVAGVENPAF